MNVLQLSIHIFRQETGGFQMWEECSFIDIPQGSIDV